MKKVVWILILLIGCIDPYVPSELKPAGSILVIDGHIETNSKSTIRITRSQNLLENIPPSAEYFANVQVEGENGDNFTLTDEGNGNYTLLPQVYSEQKYRLHVRTFDGKEFASDFVPIINSPDIDSISWKVNENLGIDILANTHDDNNSKGYYRWRFMETWQYSSKYQSIYEYDFENRFVSLRKDDIYTCWRDNPSKDILVYSTNQLSRNLVSEFPITIIDQQNERLRYTYSILVTQYGISEEAYSYWNQLKKTTEDLGTLFSPLPSQVAGNYTCISNIDEPVLGYFSIGSTSSKRIFINSLEVPRPNEYVIPSYEGCEQYELFNSDVPNFTGPYLLNGGIPNPNGPGIIGYYYSVVKCADCRVAGGTNVKPAFWP